ncbi:MAG: putative ATP-grasp superfamily ATP-dependent carboligase [Pirellulaceae bacterium]|jgi:predicted ATP-grasp superfamily ATP-dependent carboligase
MSISRSSSADSLLLIGASVRAATQSAQRAGFCSYSIDLFNDIDLRKCGNSAKIEDYRDLPLAIRQFPPAPFLFTGGLENYPKLLQKISERNPLLGCAPRCLSQVTDSQLLFEFLAQHRFNVIPWAASLSSPAVPDGERWIRKPHKSCGGFGIQFVDRTSPQGDAPEIQRSYLQRYQSGKTLGVVFVTNGSSATLVGATEQISGAVDSPLLPFRYVGSIGPMGLSKFVQDELSRLANLLTDQFQLRGIVGVDIILNNDEFYVLEVNPRYTASAEILERATNRCLIEEHVAACRSGVLPAPSDVAPSDVAPSDVAPSDVAPSKIDLGCTFQKRILYAAADGRIGRRFVEWHNAENNWASEEWPHVTDLPDVEQSILAGQPICTLFAEGSDWELCANDMSNRKLEAIRNLGFPCV